MFYSYKGEPLSANMTYMATTSSDTAPDPIQAVEDPLLRALGALGDALEALPGIEEFDTVAASHLRWAITQAREHVHGTAYVTWALRVLTRGMTRDDLQWHGSRRTR
jgi:hypothetical protein